MIVLEPEAAALYCKFADAIYNCDDKEKNVSAAFLSGARYLLADMGGGTVDVTVHSVGSDDKLRELHHATGGAWGGTYVDLEFVCLLELIFGKDLIKQFQNESPCEWINLMSKFDIAKRTVSPGSKLRVILPFQFFQFVIEEGSSVEKYIKNFQNENVKFHRGALVLLYPEAEKLFEPVFEKIVHHLESIMKTVGNITHAILVGGFATLPILQQRVREKVVSCSRVMAVRECSLAIVMGAVLYGHDPTPIASRRVKYTYGMEIWPLFDEELDPDSYRTFDAEDGAERCKHRLHIFVQRNDELEVGQEVMHEFSPYSADMTEAYICIYSSEIPLPRYTTDKGVKKVAEMTLPMPNTEGGKKRSLHVAMRFGKTEIEIVSTHASSNTEVRGTVKNLDFLGHSE